jgi:hypothetical protein
VTIKKFSPASTDIAIYRYQTPQITSIQYSASGVSTNGAIITGGTLVTVNGTNFYTGIYVIVDRAPITAVTLVNSTQLTFTAPVKAAAGIYDFFVVNVSGATGQYPHGIFYSANPFSIAYSLSTGGVTTVNEGGNFTVTLTTSAPDGTTVPYTITGVSSSDIAGTSLTGQFTVNSGTAALNITVSADRLTEGNETFTVSLNNVGSVVSASVTIVDTSLTPTYSLSTGGVTTVNEGGSFTVSLTTTNLSNGSAVAYTISGVSSADINGANLVGNFIINNNTATLPVSISADLDTEGAETFTLNITGASPAAFTSVAIVDTSTTPISYALSTGGVTTVNEGGSFTVTLTTTGIATGTLVPYTITGISSADIGGINLTGNFTVAGTYSSASATLPIAVTADQFTEGTETFTITLNNVTPTTSRSVTFVDSSLTPNYSLIIGPTTVNEGGNFTVTLNTVNTAVGSLIPYTITGVNSADIGGVSLTGNFTISGTYASGTASLPVTVTADQLTEGSETFRLTLDGVSPATYVTIIINDTSTTPVPDAPTIGTATAVGTTSISVAYTAPAYEGGASITSYTAVSSPGNVTGTVYQNGSGSITVNGLTAGFTYSFRVYATSSAGNSAYSQSSNSLTPWTIPGAPTIGTATATGKTTATVAYTAPANNGGNTITSYTAVSSPGGVTGTLSQAGSGTISVSGLSAGGTYTFTVYATNSLGNSSSSGSSNQITTTQEVPTGSLEYLVVAGGGSGGSAPQGRTAHYHGGGGGAGGYLSGTTGISAGTPYTVTVGGGGPGVNKTIGTQGSNSTFGGTTSTGGGYGGMYVNGGLATGGDGGSGGGGGRDYGNYGNGIAGQGNRGAPIGGGGGGAGAVGVSTGQAPKGGDGLPSSITGSSTYYAGGGGGGNMTNLAYCDSAGGAGGGGTGRNVNNCDGPGGSGQANTGGGGGAGGCSQPGGDGGSGVVIIAYPNTYAPIASITGGLGYDQPSRSGYRVYRFTSGTGTITW